MVHVHEEGQTVKLNSPSNLQPYISSILDLLSATGYMQYSIHTVAIHAVYIHTHTYVHMHTQHMQYTCI